MILHVAGALRAGRIELAFELREDLGDRLADHRGQHGQAAAMRHAHDHFVHIVSGGAFQQFVEDGDGGFRAFEREALLADEARVQKMFELLGLRAGLQNAHARFAVERPVVGLRLHAMLQPALSARDAGCSCTRSRFCRSRSGAAFRGFRAAWRQACGPCSPMASLRLPVRNSRSRSQMVRP